MCRDIPNFIQRGGRGGRSTTISAIFLLLSSVFPQFVFRWLHKFVQPLKVAKTAKPNKQTI
jgi:hypothetical protein